MVALHIFLLAVVTVVISASLFAVRPRNQSLEIMRLDDCDAGYKKKNRRNTKVQNENWTARIGNFFSHIGNGALKLVGRDKESREKRELSRVMYAEFDKIFEGTGNLQRHREKLPQLSNKCIHSCMYR